MTGTLYVIATPIGNLADMSFRAVETLKQADTIFCEDTRVTKKLLRHYDIQTPCVPYHSFSGFITIARAERLLRRGKDIALVSDAGTPTVSDPGVKFVRHIRDTVGAPIRVIPGPSALSAALSVSGAPASSFLFLGFLPRKRGRESLFRSIADEKRTVVLYESPHRLLKTLEALCEHLDPRREVIVAREMTKVYEQLCAGTPDEVLAYYQEHADEVRGEIVIIISELVRRG